MAQGGPSQSRLVLVGLGLVASLFGCARTASSVSIQVDAKPGATVAHLEIDVDVEGMPLRTVQAGDASGQVTLPGLLVVKVPDKSVRVKIQARGELDDGVVVTAVGQVMSSAFTQVKMKLLLDLPPNGEAGQACGTPEDCLSGFCVEGVCCDTACDGACATCINANGAPADGTCGPRHAGLECRAAAGACDIAEACDGTTTACPADGFAPNGTTCRASVGTCDIAEVCTGAAPDCPADATLCSDTQYCDGNACVAKKTLGQPCTAPVECSSSFCADGNCCDTACDGGPCENCAGTSGGAKGTCTIVPAIRMQVCRAAAGPCDAPDHCDGTNAACSADAYKPAGSVCRAAAGACDAAETCNGSNVNCPVDKLQPGGTICRAAAGVCDAQEVCSGVAAACPADAYKSGNVCRAAVNSCDVAESCSGSSPDCPADAKRGLVASECASPSTVACNQPIYDSCNNSCGTVGTMACGMCSTFSGPSCGMPAATLLAGPLNDVTRLACADYCNANNAPCCAWYRIGVGDGDCYAYTGDCTMDCTMTNWFSAVCY